ncbi:MAG: hypothetical protein DRP91_09670 [Candidatus Neomarinimicrobiota bacterium]|nr:MAG: hypothetical protein DRP91_09670 [Candidatus Neomarinimicrobiota bacterium]
MSFKAKAHRNQARKANWIRGNQVEENLKPTLKDAEGIKEVQWGLPSPFFGEQRKDNPKAKNARFRVDNVVVGDEPIEVFINDKKVAEIVITK